MYYVEEPYGHLMLEEAAGASERTKVRGNLFSFAMPWEDIEKNCGTVLQMASVAAEQRKQEISSQILLPHDEEMLATLLNVHIVGGSTDLATHLEGATIRPAVIEELIGCCLFHICEYEILAQKFSNTYIWFIVQNTILFIHQRVKSKDIFLLCGHDIPLVKSAQMCFLCLLS